MMRAAKEPSAAGTADEYLAATPAAGLRRYVASYSGYRQRGLAPAIHRGLPSPFLTLIFTLHEPLTVAAHPDPAQQGGDFQTLLGGLHTTPALIAHDGAQSGIQVAVWPLGARALFGLPAGELAGIDIPADAALGRTARRIQARIQAAVDWPGRFAVLDEEFTGMINVTTPAMPEVTWAWRALIRSGGAIPVARLAAETGWSSRYLARRFSEEIGLTPKAVARVARFDRARRQLAVPGGSATGSRIADVAAACGYFDQAHLAREFRELAGCSPSQWLAAAYPAAEYL